MPYLVDGNNLAHALGLAGSGLPDREACARLVASFCRAQGAKATIVFDGPRPQGSPGVADNLRLRVLFSESRTADSVILQLLRASSAPRDFTVVSSDKSLGDKSRHAGALVVRAHEFSRRLDRPRKGPASGSEKPALPQNAGEIDAWLAIFDPKRR